jgi:hypothetical protein
MKFVVYIADSLKKMVVVYVLNHISKKYTAFMFGLNNSKLGLAERKDGGTANVRSVGKYLSDGTA